MEQHKISKLLKDSTVSEFVTRKWIKKNDLLGGQYSVNKHIRFKTPMLRPDLCNYSDECIVVKGEITVKGTDNANKRNKKVIFKNNAPFRSCISKINNAFVDNAEDFDLVIPMYNLLEYSNNNFVTSASLWNYYRDEVNDATNEIVANYRINNNKTTTSKSFECKKKILGSTPANTKRLDAEVVVPLKYFSNFWRSFNLSLINCEIDPDLTWSKKFVISEILRTP